MITFFSILYGILLIAGIIGIPVLLILAFLFDKPRKSNPVVDEMRRQRALNYYNDPVVKELKNKD